MADQDYLVLGDLTRRELGEYAGPERHLIVRMFVGESIFDEEIEVGSLSELPAVVEKRIAALRKKPDKAKLVESDSGWPADNPGHAIDLSEAT
jgi:hypothetical protein